ncbi:MAG TPA: class IV adenylate cyclase [bacterium]
MQNIEIKACCPDLAKAKAIAVHLGAQFGGELHQIDTYFQVKSGRLKLREINYQENQLIYYERPDEAGARLSNYHIYPVSDPDLLKALLTSALGILTVIEKRRVLYWLENVRIHLDRVKDMGDFIEFEGIVDDAHRTLEVMQKVASLQNSFQILSSNLVRTSYADLNL